MPQLDPSGFLPQLIWLAITFVALYLLMARLALPRVADVLEERSKRRESNLAKAEQLQAESEAIATAYQMALDEARNSAQARVAAALEKTREANDRKIAEKDAELAARFAREEGAIRAAREQASGDAAMVAGEVAQLATEKVAGVAVDENAARSAAEDVMKARAG